MPRKATKQKTIGEIRFELIPNLVEAFTALRITWPDGFTYIDPGYVITEDGVLPNAVSEIYEDNYFLPEYAAYVRARALKERPDAA